MNAKDVIKFNLNLAHQVTNAYVGDLSEEELHSAPVKGMNPIGWQLGHLVSSERGMISGTGHAMPELPAGFEERHSRDVAKAGGPWKFASKAEYLGLIQKMHDATLAALDKMADADLDKPGPENMREIAPTVGGIFAMIGLHELMHAGQYVAQRRKLGKPVTI